MTILDNVLHSSGIELDRLGRLCAEPRGRRLLGLLKESDASYRVRLRPALVCWLQRGQTVGLGAHREDIMLAKAGR